MESVRTNDLSIVSSVGLPLGERWERLTEDTFGVWRVRRPNDVGRPWYDRSCEDDARPRDEEEDECSDEGGAEHEGCLDRE